MSSIRVILAEDHDLVRAGVRSLLENNPQIEIIAEASDGVEALRLIAQHQPDVVLMDIRMSGLNGLDTTRQVKQQYPQVQVIMLSMYADEEYVLQALRAGATGYLLKNTNPADLARAICVVAQGEIFLSQEVSRHVWADYMRHVTGGQATTTAQSQTRDVATSSPATTSPDAHDVSSVAAGATLSFPQRAATTAREGRAKQESSAKLESNPASLLTPRQLEILRLIVQSQTTQEIAKTLGISPKTVETHRAQLMDKLGIYDVVGLVRYAMQKGLVPLDE